MFADKNGTRLLAAKFPENLRALAIKPFAKLDVCRDRIRPPVPFDMSIRPDVAHDCRASLQLTLVIDRKLDTCATIMKEIYLKCKASRKHRRAPSVPGRRPSRRCVRVGAHGFDADRD